MKNKKSGLILISIGMLFLVNAIFGRYLVLPGYLKGLETAGGTLEGAVSAASPWEIFRYLLWAYSFKLGIFFCILGALNQTEMHFRRKILIGAAGFAYIVFAYIPLPEQGSIIYGLSGGIMTILMLYIFLRWAKERDKLDEPHKEAGDYRMAGYFFFGMATYTICPLLGVRTFALAPEKMLKYGMQAEAASFALHLLIELLLGWIFIAVSIHKLKTNSP